MNMQKRDNLLLEQYIKELIKEYDGGGDMSSGMMDMWGFRNYGPSLSTIFIDPFTDVFKTVKAGVEDMSVRVKTLLITIANSMLSTFLPVLQTRYKNIFQRQEDQLDKIQAKYKDVFAATDAAFSDDVMFLTFMYDPAAWITAKTLKYSPKLAGDIIDTFIGKDSLTKDYLKDIKNELTQIEQDIRQIPQYRELRNVAAPKPYLTLKRKNALKAANIPLESVQLGEAEETVQPTDDQKKLTPQQRLTNLLNRKELRDAINNSQLAKQMRGDSSSLVNGMRTEAEKELNTVLQANDLRTLGALVGKNYETELAKIPQEERVEAEKQLLSVMKSSMLKFYKTMIGDELNVLKEKGLPQNNAYFKTFQSLLSKIN